MNQDNLKYIQSQIKQKNKKNNSTVQSKKAESADAVEDKALGYPEKI